MCVCVCVCVCLLVSYDVHTVVCVAKSGWLNILSDVMFD